MFSRDKYSAVIHSMAFLPLSFVLIAGIIINVLLYSGGNCEMAVEGLSCKTFFSGWVNI